MKNIFVTVLLMMIVNVGNADPRPSCANYSAMVRLDAAYVGEMQLLVMSTSWMPLNAVVFEITNGIALVEVSVDSNFAKDYALNSFDVAKRTAGLLSSSTHKWGVRSIEANMCFDSGSFNPNNVGTIGHK